MKSLRAPAKINLALVVGPRRGDGLHEVATVLQRLDLADRLDLETANNTEIEGFPEDTLVREALRSIGVTARVSIEKRIPVAAGLGGGSSDAAATLRWANATLAKPLGATKLHQLARSLGTDVPFFLREGPHIGRGNGAALSRIDLPQDYWVVLLLTTGAKKVSTKAVYDAFDGEGGFAGRREALLTALEAGDLAALPPNDLASSPLARELMDAGAFRADVSGAGPAVYGLFADRDEADAARERFAGRCATWLTAPAW
jgi:4-diphosphocytidyl-2-C-methyl-D-erythritol kinase